MGQLVYSERRDRSQDDGEVADEEAEVDSEGPKTLDDIIDAHSAS